MVVFDTRGRLKLRGLGLGPSEIARRLGCSPSGKPVPPSTVSRWLSGMSRPDAVYRPALAMLAGTADADWLTEAETRAVAAGLRVMRGASKPVARPDNATDPHAAQEEPAA
jgi:transcriptional regulator with XRE-family HTH domain